MSTQLKTRRDAVLTGGTNSPKHAMNPYVFIVGCPRSGTTLLKRMVKAHPEITITRETHWVPRPFEKQKGVTADGTVTDRIVDELFSHHRFEQMKVKRHKLKNFVGANPGLTYAQLVSEIYDQYGRRKGKQLVGDKSPPYVRKIPTLMRLWPNTRIVHIIRDGRNVWLSIRNWRMAHKTVGQFATWNIDPLVTTALWWRVLVSLGHEDGEQVGDRQYHEIRYESLVENPEAQCKRLAAFLELAYASEMVRYHEGKTRSCGALSANAAWLPPTPNLRDWQTQMSAGEVERFEAAAGDALEALGYHRACCKIPDDVKDDVLRIRQQFAEEAIKRNWRLPTTW